MSFDTWEPFNTAQWDIEGVAVHYGLKARDSNDDDDDAVD